jgi:nicotinate-nucleotide pyrophosphorylase (carboxylating)
MKLDKQKILPIIMNELKEDIGSGDITGNLLFEKNVKISAEITVKEKCVVAGLDAAKWIFNALDENIVVRRHCKDGDTAEKGKKIISLKGPARNILAGERTALNFLGRLSGIASLTAAFVKEVEGTGAKILDTRKTMPGLRSLDKYAVTAGGGANHRMGLWDDVLIKDNHLEGLMAVSKISKPRAIGEALKKAREKRYKNILVEVDNLKEFDEAVRGGADIIMLDNMNVEDIKKAVGITLSLFKSGASRPLLEVSGGVNLKTVRKIAGTGVDRISIGAITHSVPSIDFSLEIC